MCAHTRAHTCTHTDIPSDPPFAGWAHNFHDKPTYPLTLLQNPHCKVDLATSWPSAVFCSCYTWNRLVNTQFGLRIAPPD